MATSSLQGKSVIVTGASKGIGKGIARVFAQAGGAKVLVVSRHLKEAEAAAKDFGNGASGFAADVTKPEDMAAMAKAANDRYGGIDVLCANAGVFPQVKLEEMSVDQWDGTFAINVKGCFLSVQACVPYLK
jgi:3-oxoacyl-[acyl-carrier protein] reductase